MDDKRNRPQREYPAIYERLIPIVLSILAVFVIVMILYSLAVASGLLQFG